MTKLTRHQARLAPYVTGSWFRSKGHPYLYLNDSREPGGARSVRCLGSTITALCEAGILEEDHHDTGVHGGIRGGINECSRSRSPSAGPARDLALKETR